MDESRFGNLVNRLNLQAPDPVEEEGFVPIRASEPVRPPTSDSLVRLTALLPRVLMGLFVALTTARFSLGGNDPVRLEFSPAFSSAILNLLLLSTALAWAILVGPRHGGGRGALVLVGFLGAAGWPAGVFTAADWNPHIAWRIVWETGLAGITFLMARQLTTDVTAVRTLLAVFGATAVALAIIPIWEGVARPLAIAGIDPRPQPFRSTFESPSIFAGFLVLILPALFVCAIHGPKRLTVPFLLALAGLLLTRAALIVAAFAIAGLMVWGLSSRTLPRDRVTRGLLGALLLVVGGVWFLPDEGHIFPIDRWNAEWESIQARSPQEWWFGSSPPYLPVENSWAGLALTVGLPAPLCLLLVLAVTGFRAAPERDELARLPGMPSAAPRWEFYMGAVGGLFLGLLLLIRDQPFGTANQRAFDLGGQAIIRSIVWFFAFAILEQTTASRRTLGLALLSGLAAWGIAALMVGLITPVLLHAVALTAALAFSVREVTYNNEPIGNLVRRYAAVPILFLGLLLYSWMIARTDHATRSAVRDIQREAIYFAQDQENIAKAVKKGQREQYLTIANNRLNRLILERLREAQREDPGNLCLVVEELKWQRERWNFCVIGLDMDLDGELRKLLYRPKQTIERIEELVQEAERRIPGGVEWRREARLTCRYIIDRPLRHPTTNALRVPEEYQRMIELERRLSSEPQPAR